MADREGRPRPRVSIVTPSYNHAEFLEEAIRSVEAQDYPDVEHLVVDGGSHDGSVEIIRRHEAQLAWWVSERDRGQSHAINKGFARATGDVLAWLNSDDLLFPDAVSRAVEALEARPDAPLAYGDCVFVNRRSQFLRYFTEIEPFDRYRLRNCSDYVMQPATFFRRAALAAVGPLDVSIRYAMDWDLWCRMAALGDFVRVPTFLAANREYGTTKTRTGGLARLAEIAGIWRRHRSSLWPTILFGLAGAELYAAQAEAESRINGFALGVLRRACSVGALRNRAASRRSVLEAMGGFIPHSPWCHREASVVVPVYREASRLAIVALCPFRDARGAPQSMSVAVNGEDLGTVAFAGDLCVQTLAFPLPPSVARSHVARVDLRFARDYGERRIAARLDHVLLA